MNSGLTVQEKQVIDSLVKTWGLSLRLPVAHNDDITEFRTCIHQCQNMILSRPTLRELNKEYLDDNNS